MTTTPNNFVDLTGLTFNRWSVLERVANKGGHASWGCVCICGNRKDVSSHNLTAGVSKSCGCLSLEVLVSRSTKHGHAKRGNHSRTYTIWEGLYKRCHVPTNKAYKDYGARGIYVCVSWLEFERFLSDMGECPDGLSLERIDNDKGYSPCNCKWATQTEQARNRRGVQHISAFGKTMTIPEWAEDTGLSYHTIYLRLRKGASGEEAVGRGWYSRKHQKTKK